MSAICNNRSHSTSESIQIAKVNLMTCKQRVKNKQEFYSTNVSTVGDKTEFTWCHNLGGQSKNFSRIYIDAYKNSKFGQDYEIITTNIGNSSFTLEFIKF